MKRSLLIFIIACLPLECILGQNMLSLDSTILRENIKHKYQLECDYNGIVKDTLYSWTYDKMGRLTKSLTYSGGKVFSSTHYTYNKFNIADSVYNQVVNGKRYLSRVNVFNQSNQIISTYRCFEKKGCLKSEAYEYIDENLSKRTEFRQGIEDTYYFYEYDDKGNLISKVTQYKSGTSIKSLSYYNDDDLKIKSVSYSPKGEPMDSTYYEYDHQGNLTYLNWIGGLNTKSRYRYDDLNNNIEYQSLSKSGETTNHRVMEYKGKLMKTRIHYNGSEINRYFLFTYSRH